MRGGKYVLVTVILVLAGFLFFFGFGGAALTFFEWFLSSANAFVSAVSNFLKWLLP